MAQNNSIIAFITRKDSTQASLFGLSSFVVFSIVLSCLLMHVAIVRYDLPDLKKHAEINYKKLEWLAFQVASGMRTIDDAGASPCTTEDLSIFSQVLKQYYLIGDIGRVENGKLVCSFFSGTDISKPMYENDSDYSESIRVVDPSLLQGSQMYSSLAFIKGDLIFFASHSYLKDQTIQNAIKHSIGAVLHSKEGEDYLFFGDVEGRQVEDTITHQNTILDYLPISGKSITVSYCSDHVNICVTSVDSELGLFRATETFVLGSLSGTFLLSLLIYHVFYLSVAGSRGLSNHLKWAIRRRKIYTVYQPQICLKSNQLVGIEVLARWNSHKYGVVPPDVFIPFCENKGYMMELTKLVIEKSLEELSTLLKNNRGLTVSLNVSTSVFTDPKLQPILDEQCEIHDIAPEQVLLEITERTTSPENDLLAASKKFSDANYKVSLDDFGTGNANLSWLTILNPDEVKIDKMFTQAVGKKSAAGYAFEGLISMLKDLSVRVVFEGIETKSDLQRLESKLPESCGQGWYFSKPLTYSSLKEWLTDWPPENK